MVFLILTVRVPPFLNLLHEGDATHTTQNKAQGIKNNKAKQNKIE